LIAGAANIVARAAFPHVRTRVVAGIASGFATARDGEREGSTNASARNESIAPQLPLHMASLKQVAAR
jgi:hypothetical protein